MGKKHLPKQKIENKSKKISEEATAKATQGETTDHLKPSFRFKHADPNRWCLSKWEAEEIVDLMRALQKIENHTWLQIKSQGSKTRGESVGCGFKVIKQHPTLPSSVSDDTVISEMRVCKKKRIFGFRIDSIYYIVWFDRDHSVCPE
ncbi:MAG6450 family protein [Nostoc sp.]|uniref:MAG6450 family protein n=1 Tax=Nostoc sp. TaxID=1180 RepID=UPI002FFD4557